jgi:hypothetical protein
MIAIRYIIIALCFIVWAPSYMLWRLLGWFVMEVKAIMDKESAKVKA